MGWAVFTSDCFMQHSVVCSASRHIVRGVATTENCIAHAFATPNSVTVMPVHLCIRLTVICLVLITHTHLFEAHCEWGVGGGGGVITNMMNSLVKHLSLSLLIQILFLSVCVCVFMSVSVCVCVCVCLIQHLSLSSLIQILFLSVCVCVFVSVCVCVCVCVCLIQPL